jgi:hypothetical protein
MVGGSRPMLSMPGFPSRRLVEAFRLAAQSRAAHMARLRSVSVKKPILMRAQKSR